VEIPRVEKLEGKACQRDPNIEQEHSFSTIDILSLSTFSTLYSAIGNFSKTSISLTLQRVKTTFTIAFPEKLNLLPPQAKASHVVGYKLDY